MCAAFIRIGPALRRRLSLGLIAALSCVSGIAHSDSFPTEVRVNLAQPLGAVKPLILGSNLQWVDRGDEMFLADGRGIAPAMLDSVTRMGVTMLRYPGGAQSDLYHWRAGMGALAGRGEGEHFHSGRKQKIEVGTQEFLELCEALGAEPLITVNVASGSAEEAAEWVRAVNTLGLQSRRTGRPLPRVRYWEIGNEPYLRDDRQKKLWLDAATYASRAQDFITAMRNVDPGIDIALPLRSDALGGVPATPLPGFNETVLRHVSAPFDRVALHNAYLPFDYRDTASDEARYWASVAATRVVEADIAHTRAQLERLQPGRRIALAVTEYNALFSLGGAADAQLRSPAGALYVADLLRLFAYTPGLDYANFWSLSGNWHFGALSNRGAPRPVMRVLSVYRETLKGSLLTVAVRTSTVDTPRVGFVPAMRAVPLVKALATLEGNTLRVLLINHDPHAASGVRIDLGEGKRWRKGVAQSWRAAERFDSREEEGVLRPAMRPLAAGQGSLNVEVPAMALGLVELELERAR